MYYSSELETALKAAKVAGNYLKTVSTKSVVNGYKGNFANYSTKQDLEVDSIIKKEINTNFPKDIILSEELSSDVDLKGHERIWIVDPIDGTRNFFNGNCYFSISIALYINDSVKIGVVYAPMYNNELYYAEKGKGVYLNGNKLKTIRPEQDLKSSIVTTGFSYFKGDELKKPLKVYAEVLNNVTDIVRYGSAALDLCQVAAGRCGAYFEYGLKPWDIAAGMLIVEEAGGLVSEFNGEELLLINKQKGKYIIPNIVSSKNKEIHKKLLSVINSKL